MRHSFFLSFLLLVSMLQTATADEFKGDQGIFVTGNCIKKISQDRGGATITTKILAPTASESSKKATKDNEVLRSAILALKLEGAKLETSGYSVYEDREYRKNKMITRGFATQINLVVETSDLARLGEIVAAATKVGGKEVSGLNTFVSPEKRKAEYESCLEVATRNARDKAEKLAKGIGLKVGKVISIQEGGEQTPMHREMMPTAYAAASADGTASSAPTIDVKDEQLSVSATVRFALD